MLSQSRSQGPAAAPKSAGPESGAPGKSNGLQQDRLKTKGVGEASAPQEAQADSLAHAVQRHMKGQQGQGETAKPKKFGLSEELIRAFEEEAGVNLSNTAILRGGEADRLAKQVNAKAFAADKTAVLSSDLSGGESEWALIHELAHIALGHADGNQPVRRLAQTSDLKLGSLKRGSTGAAVERLQGALVTLGFMTAKQKATGPGIFGNRTESAVKAFQASARIEVDGLVGPKTEAALEAALAGNSKGSEPPAKENKNGLTGSPPLELGDSGASVKLAQQRLNHYGASLMADGEFGPRTKTAVLGFQKANGLSTNGTVDGATAAALSGSTAKKIATEAPKPDEKEDPVKNDGPVNVGDADPKGILSSSKVNPTVKEKATKVVEGLQKRGLSPYIFEGHRTMERQNDLYAQGRTKGGKIVTYVKGGGSWHNYGLAVDIVFWDPKHKGPSWGGPSSQWQAVGKEAKQAGFTRWLGSMGDYPHMEYHPNWGNDCSSLLSTYNKSGLSGVWKKVA